MKQPCLYRGNGSGIDYYALIKVMQQSKGLRTQKCYFTMIYSDTLLYCLLDRYSLSCELPCLIVPKTKVFGTIYSFLSPQKLAK